MYIYASDTGYLYGTREEHDDAQYTNKHTHIHIELFKRGGYE